MNNKSIIQFLKFAVIGASNTAVDWAIFFLLNFIVFFDIHEYLAKAISFIIAALNSFYLNTVWTFRDEYQTEMGKVKSEEEKTIKRSKYLIKFILISVVGWLLNTGIFVFFRYQIFSQLNSTYSKIISLAFASAIALVWNFIANKKWTYRVN